MLQVETRITCPLSAMQTAWYRRLLLKDSALLIKLEKEDLSMQAIKVLNAQSAVTLGCVCR